MSRKAKFSRNGKKAKARVQKMHTRIAHVRKEFLYKTTISAQSCLSQLLVLVSMELELIIRKEFEELALSVVAQGAMAVSL
jgi:hypothetical protein